MTDEKLDRHILDILPMGLLEIYAHFGASWTAAKKTKRKVRARLNALIDEGKVYTKGPITSVIYHKREEYQEKI